MKMEPTVSSETSVIRTKTPRNYPKRNKLHLEHGESLKKERCYKFEDALTGTGLDDVPEGQSVLMCVIPLCFIQQ